MMSPRERWLAALQMEPVDRLPFWPKLDAAYPRAQDPPFRDRPADEIHRWIGSDRHVGVPGCVREVRRRTSIEAHRTNGTRTTVFRAPGGSTRQVSKFDEPSQAWHPVEFPVRTVEDIEIVAECFRDCTVELDKEAAERARARADEVGDSASTHCGIGKSPLMNWVEWLAGVETAHYLLADRAAEVEGLFDALHAVLCRRAEILAHESPADMLYMVENTSTTLISPRQHARYCEPHISEYGRITAEAGKPLVLHMCGKLKGLLGQLNRIPARAFEAFTSAPVGDTSLLDGRTACPHKCLIGGTDATLWTRPAEQIIARVERDLDALPHHRGVVVTSAGVMPPMCRPETIKQVCQWVHAYEPRA